MIFYVPLSILYEIDENISSLLHLIPFQVLSHYLSADREVDVLSNIFNDFDEFMKTKI